MEVDKPFIVRFAPSPTGGLHIGGVRTALYNYLLAHKNKYSSFIVRLEDTDRDRFVPQAETYILSCLQWLGLSPDESPSNPKPNASYRQSERLDLYKKYADFLINKGWAYYSFDSTEELNELRKNNPNFIYNYQNRLQLKNSLSLTSNEVDKLISNKTSFTIRLKTEPFQKIEINDLIRGTIQFQSEFLDDKVLLKADGFPTYHLAVVVDDYLMNITHVLRGEEWLSSAPTHVILWKYLFGLEKMPQWLHLPLILKPNGKGKLSKRDGLEFGMPIYALNWHNNQTETHIINGFKESGFLPQALVNFLALMGWNSGTAQELYSLEELISEFSINHIHKTDALFDFDKAKWFNHQWMIRLTAAEIIIHLKPFLEQSLPQILNHKNLLELIELTKERCVLLTDFIKQLSYFVEAPKEVAVAAIANEQKNIIIDFFQSLLDFMSTNQHLQSNIEWKNLFNEIATEKKIQLKQIQLPFRIALVGDKFGPDVFKIAEYLGTSEVRKRIDFFITKI
ncbi:MAG: glutamate--tRNA ligase [Sediminibacterium sp.]|nr:glutamate--tRNA ligase [Sediminibacterium sp.]